MATLGRKEKGLKGKWREKKSDAKEYWGKTRGNRDGGEA